MNPELLETSLPTYPADVVARARSYVSAVPSVGAYSDSQGVPLVREHVAQFIAERAAPAGGPAVPEIASLSRADERRRALFELPSNPATRAANVGGVGSKATTR